MNAPKVQPKIKKKKKNNKHFIFTLYVNFSVIFSQINELACQENLEKSRNQKYQGESGGFFSGIRF